MAIGCCVQLFVAAGRKAVSRAHIGSGLAAATAALEASCLLSVPSWLCV
jgi:hypothetical protein